MTLGVSLTHNGLLGSAIMTDRSPSREGPSGSGSSHRSHRSRGSRGSHRRSSRSKRRRLIRQVIAASLTLILLVVLGFVLYGFWERGMFPANEASEDWFEVKGTPKVRVELPRDDAHHSNFMEWWYYNGHLEGESGNQYSFHFTMFLVDTLTVHTVAHVSFVDHQTGRHYAEQKRSTGNPSRGIQDGFDFNLGDWRMTGGGGEDRLRVLAKDFSFSLELTEGVPPVMQGGTGLLDFGLAGESYYYTRPRMPITGTLKVGDLVERVSGVAWFDHQWGDFEILGLGWSWFALQLDDGTDVMLYELFDKGGLPVLRSGSSTRDGVTRVLSGNDFNATVKDEWVSGVTGTRYPMEWDVEIPSEDIRVNVKPIIRESEFDGRVTAYVVYWEGAVKVAGTHAGRGFVELSGFERLFKGDAVDGNRD